MVPYFWSDQYGKKIQMLGHARPDDDVVRVSGSSGGGQVAGALPARRRGDRDPRALPAPRARVVQAPVGVAVDPDEGACDDAPWSR